jgi:hypothetical protein
MEVTEQFKELVEMIKKYSTYTEGEAHQNESGETYRYDTYISRSKKPKKMPFYLYDAIDKALVSLSLDRFSDSTGWVGDYCFTIIRDKFGFYGYRLSQIVIIKKV